MNTTNFFLVENQLEKGTNCLKVIADGKSIKRFRKLLKDNILVLNSQQISRSQNQNVFSEEVNKSPLNKIAIKSPITYNKTIQIKQYLIKQFKKINSDNA